MSCSESGIASLVTLHPAASYGFPRRFAVILLSTVGS